jgi:threonine dehydrogenase-like Zn-dependent dehydrogenase
VPDTIGDEEAVFVEPLAAAYRILEQVSFSPFGRVIVMGDGKLGLLVAQVLRQVCSDLTVIGKHKANLHILQERGIQTALLDEYRGNQAEYIIDCTGSPTGFRHALSLICPGGILVLKSTCADSFSFDESSIVIHEVTIIGSRCGPFEPAIRALSDGVVDIKPLISRVMPLDRGIDAFAIAQDGETVKVLLRIGHVG